MDIPDDDPATGHHYGHTTLGLHRAPSTQRTFSGQHKDQDVEEMQRPEGPEPAVTRRKAAPRHPTGHDAL